MTRLPMIVLLGCVLVLGAMAHDAEAGARRSRPLRSGQTTCWDSTGMVIACTGTDQDGDLQRGEPRSYLDNGDGTIRDKRTALTWEKQSNDGSVHDKDTLLSWAGAFAKIDALNTTPCFAGFCDWRLPSALELVTLVDFGTSNPSIAAPFNTACPNGCTVLTCSCTFSNSYWTSTTEDFDPTSAFVVSFFTGAMGFADKTLVLFRARAVRGGS